MKKTCCFSGHGPQNLTFGYNVNDERCIQLKCQLKAEIVKMITEKNVGYFISGMALGVDTFAAEIILSLKKDYPFLSLECAIPHELQAVRWNENDRDRYFSIVENCDRESLLQTKYTKDCLQKRNQYMVDHSDYLIAVWDGTESGTGSTVKYAEKQKTRTVVIHVE